MRDLFLLDPDIVFLNHGSFGACPRPVFDVYREWQAELERQPVEFLNRRVWDLLAEARRELPPWNGRLLLRISVQGYNTPADVDALLAALGGML